MTKDEEARARGYTRACFIDSGGFESCDALVKPDDDYDGFFTAWSVDWQMYTTVNGSAVLIEWEDDA